MAKFIMIQPDKLRHQHSSYNVTVLVYSHFLRRSVDGEVHHDSTR
jgi:hypothetical protein